MLIFTGTVWDWGEGRRYRHVLTGEKVEGTGMYWLGRR